MKYRESINTSRRLAPGTNCQESASGSKNQRMMRMKMMYCKRPSPFIGSIIGVIEELVDLKKSYQELQKSSLKDIGVSDQDSERKSPKQKGLTLQAVQMGS